VFRHALEIRGEACFKRIIHHRGRRGLRAGINDTTGAFIGAAVSVHRELGPGLLESSHETCLCYELIQRGITVERQKKLPLMYNGVDMQTAYPLDLLVNKSVVVELKSVTRIEGVHLAAVLTYLVKKQFLPSPKPLPLVL